MKLLQALLALLWLTATATAQTTVRQSGTITPGHAVKWLSTGVIADAGTAASGALSSLGVTNNGGPGICVNSAPITSPYNQLCLSATTSAAAQISVQNFNGASATGINFVINGVTSGFPAVNLPVSTNDLACFADTSGTLKDCGPGSTIPVNPVTYGAVCSSGDPGLTIATANVAALTAAMANPNILIPAGCTIWLETGGNNQFSVPSTVKRLSGVSHQTSVIRQRTRSTGGNAFFHINNQILVTDLKIQVPIGSGASEVGIYINTAQDVQFTNVEGDAPRCLNIDTSKNILVQNFICTSNYFGAILGSGSQNVRIENPQLSTPDAATAPFGITMSDMRGFSVVGGRIDIISGGGFGIAVTQLPQQVVARSQAKSGAGNLTINGILTGVPTSTGIATLDSPAPILITSVGNDSGRTFTVTGTTDGTTPQTETVTGANAGSATTLSNYKTVTQISVNGAVASTVSAGLSSPNDNISIDGVTIVTGGIEPITFDSACVFNVVNNLVTGLPSHDTGLGIYANGGITASETARTTCNGVISGNTVTNIGNTSLVVNLYGQATAITISGNTFRNPGANPASSASAHTNACINILGNTSNVNAVGNTCYNAGLDTSATGGIAIGSSGSKGPFTVTANKPWIVGQFLTLYDAADLTKYMVLTITSYVGTSLSGTAVLSSGTGTPASWVIGNHTYTIWESRVGSGPGPANGNNYWANYGTSGVLGFCSLLGSTSKCEHGGTIEQSVGDPNGAGLKFIPQSSPTNYWTVQATSAAGFNINYNGNATSRFALDSSGNVILAGTLTTTRVTFDNTSPAYNLFSNTAAVNILSPFTGLSVAAGNQFYAMRVSQTTGDYNHVTLGAGSIISGYAAYIDATVGSSASGIVYTQVGVASTTGPASARGVYGAAVGQTGSTGVLAGLNGTLNVASGTDLTSGALRLDILGAANGLSGSSAPAEGSAINDVANWAYLDSSSGSRLLMGFATARAVAFNQAWARLWIDTSGSSANARALQLLNDVGGTEVSYWTKAGAWVATQYTSTVTTGTAPFVVTSTTNVANLNASSLGGATFAAPGAIGGGTPSTISGTTITATTSFSANGTAGLSTTKTVRAAGGAADCTLIYTMGLLTGGSC